MLAYLLPISTQNFIKVS